LGRLVMEQIHLVVAVSSMGSWCHFLSFEC
jgi:hypothetical protein